MQRIAMVMIVWLTTASTLLAECNANIPLTRPDVRYLDNKDGTVTDTVTGLIWRQCPEGMSSSATACDSGSAATFTWEQAQQRASDVNGTAGTTGYSDWRLPELKELKSLTEMACYNPAINTRFFPNTPARYFWSATPAVSSDKDAWGVGFFYGGDRWGLKSDLRYVRLVRGGM